jgi:hypothetical protein
MSAALDVCPQCSDPWCSCDCALCAFVTSSRPAVRARAAYDRRCQRSKLPDVARYRLVGADRNMLDGEKLRIAYYRRVIRAAARRP